ncbi:unnamed protein product [Amoebophrya sp. A120]|nr:unnamed protein product [Amoebophrya sp. A120]|eukprot:GSA120T00021945001.1
MRKLERQTASLVERQAELEQPGAVMAPESVRKNAARASMQLKWANEFYDESSNKDDLRGSEDHDQRSLLLQRAIFNKLFLLSTAGEAGPAGDKKEEEKTMNVGRLSWTRLVDLYTEVLDTLVVSTSHAPLITSLDANTKVQQLQIFLQDVYAKGEKFTETTELPSVKQTTPEHHGNKNNKISYVIEIADDENSAPAGRVISSAAKTSAGVTSGVGSVAGTNVLSSATSTSPTMTVGSPAAQLQTGTTAGADSGSTSKPIVCKLHPVQLVFALWKAVRVTEMLLENKRTRLAGEKKHINAQNSDNYSDVEDEQGQFLDGSGIYSSSFNSKRLWDRFLARTRNIKADTISLRKDIKSAGGLLRGSGTPESSPTLASPTSRGRANSGRNLRRSGTSSLGGALFGSPSESFFTHSNLFAHGNFARGSSSGAPKVSSGNDTPTMPDFEKMQLEGLKLHTVLELDEQKMLERFDVKVQDLRKLDPTHLLLLSSSSSGRGATSAGTSHAALPSGAAAHLNTKQAEQHFSLTQKGYLSDIAGAISRSANSIATSGNSNTNIKPTSTASVTTLQKSAASRAAHRAFLKRARGLVSFRSRVGGAPSTSSRGAGGMSTLQSSGGARTSAGGAQQLHTTGATGVPSISELTALQLQSTIVPAGYFDAEHLQTARNKNVVSRAHDEDQSRSSSTSTLNPTNGGTLVLRLARDEVQQSQKNRNLIFSTAGGIRQTSQPGTTADRLFESPTNVHLVASLESFAALRLQGLILSSKSPSSGEMLSTNGVVFGEGKENTGLKRLNPAPMLLRDFCLRNYKFVPPAPRLSSPPETRSRSLYDPSSSPSAASGEEHRDSWNKGRQGVNLDQVKGGGRYGQELWWAYACELLQYDAHGHTAEYLTSLKQRSSVGAAPAASDFPGAAVREGEGGALEGSASAEARRKKEEKEKNKKKEKTKRSSPFDRWLEKSLRSTKASKSHAQLKGLFKSRNDKLQMEVYAAIRRASMNRNNKLQRLLRESSDVDTPMGVENAEQPSTSAAGTTTTGLAHLQLPGVNTITPTKLFQNWELRISDLESKRNPGRGATPPGALSVFSLFYKQTTRPDESAVVSLQQEDENVFDSIQQSQEAISTRGSGAASLPLVALMNKPPALPTVGQGEVLGGSSGGDAGGTSTGAAPGGETEITSSKTLSIFPAQAGDILAKISKVVQETLEQQLLVSTSTGLHNRAGYLAAEGKELTESLASKEDFKIEAPQIYKRLSDWQKEKQYRETTPEYAQKQEQKAMKLKEIRMHLANVRKEGHAMQQILQDYTTGVVKTTKRIESGLHSAFADVEQDLQQSIGKEYYVDHTAANPRDLRGSARMTEMRGFVEQLLDNSLALNLKHVFGTTSRASVEWSQRLEQLEKVHSCDVDALLRDYTDTSATTFQLNEAALLKPHELSGGEAFVLARTSTTGEEQVVSGQLGRSTTTSMPAAKITKLFRPGKLLTYFRAKLAEPVQQVLDDRVNKQLRRLKKQIGHLDVELKEKLPAELSAKIDEQKQILRNEVSGVKAQKLRVTITQLKTRLAEEWSSARNNPHKYELTVLKTDIDTIWRDSPLKDFEVAAERDDFTDLVEDVRKKMHERYTAEIESLKSPETKEKYKEKNKKHILVVAEQTLASLSGPLAKSLKTEDTSFNPKAHSSIKRVMDKQEAYEEQRSLLESERKQFQELKTELEQLLSSFGRWLYPFGGNAAASQLRQIVTLGKDKIHEKVRELKKDLKKLQQQSESPGGGAASSGTTTTGTSTAAQQVVEEEKKETELTLEMWTDLQEQFAQHIFAGEHAELISMEKVNEADDGEPGGRDEMNRAERLQPKANTKFDAYDTTNGRLAGYTEAEFVTAVESLRAKVYELLEKKGQAVLEKRVQAVNKELTAARELLHQATGNGSRDAAATSTSRSSTTSRSIKTEKNEKKLDSLKLQLESFKTDLLGPVAHELHTVLSKEDLASSSTPAKNAAVGASHPATTTSTLTTAGNVPVKPVSQQLGNVIAVRFFEHLVKPVLANFLKAKKHQEEVQGMLSVDESLQELAKFGDFNRIRHSENAVQLPNENYLNAIIPPVLLCTPGRASGTAGQGQATHQTGDFCQHPPTSSSTAAHGQLQQQEFIFRNLIHNTMLFSSATGQQQNLVKIEFQFLTQFSNLNLGLQHENAVANHLLHSLAKPNFGVAGELRDVGAGGLAPSMKKISAAVTLAGRLAENSGSGEPAFQDFLFQPENGAAKRIKDIYENGPENYDRDNIRQNEVGQKLLHEQLVALRPADESEASPSICHADQEEGLNAFETARNGFAFFTRQDLALTKIDQQAQPGMTGGTAAVFKGDQLEHTAAGSEEDATHRDDTGRDGGASQEPSAQGEQHQGAQGHHDRAGRRGSGSSRIKADSSSRKKNLEQHKTDAALAYREYQVQALKPYEKRHFLLRHERFMQKIVEKLNAGTSQDRQGSRKVKDPAQIKLMERILARLEHALLSCGQPKDSSSFARLGRKLSVMAPIHHVPAWNSGTSGNGSIEGRGSTFQPAGRTGPAPASATSRQRAQEPESGAGDEDLQVAGLLAEDMQKLSTA